jgi:hypothetical protein
VGVLKLGDVRRLAIRKRLRVRFRLANGMECVINERGITEVPGLEAVPDFSLEDEFAKSVQFAVEPLTSQTNRRRGQVNLQTVSRQELEQLAGGGIWGRQEKEIE